MWDIANAEMRSEQLFRTIDNKTTDVSEYILIQNVTMNHAFGKHFQGSRGHRIRRPEMKKIGFGCMGYDKKRFHGRKVFFDVKRTKT